MFNMEKYQKTLSKKHFRDEIFNIFTMFLTFKKPTEKIGFHF